MLTTLPDLKRLRRAFSAIERDAVPRVFAKATWRRWRYDELSQLYGTEEDWRPRGAIRVALVGGDGRSWLRVHHRLWWTTDPKRAGILFTADPLTGIEWDRERIGTRAARDAEYLVQAAASAIESQPIYRPHFQRIQRHSDGLRRSAAALRSIHSPATPRAALDVTTAEGGT